MALDKGIRDNIVLPAVCAPMFLVSNPQLVTEACKAGIVGALPRQNARTFEVFLDWLRQIRGELDRFAQSNPGSRVGPVAINIPTKMEPAEMTRHLDACRDHGVELIISA